MSMVRVLSLLISFSSCLKASPVPVVAYFAHRIEDLPRLLLLCK